MASTKKYLKGSAKKYDGQYGEFFIVSVLKEDIANLPDNKGYVKFMITERKEPDNYGNTHSLVELEDRPKKEEEDLPFK
jgi:hypothetical protein